MSKVVHNADLLMEVIESLTKAGREELSVEEIVIAVWKKYPDIFSLRNHKEYPDSNKVIGVLMGKPGLIKKGKLRRVGKRSYKLMWQPASDEDLMRKLKQTKAFTKSQVSLASVDDNDFMEFLRVVVKNPENDMLHAPEEMHKRLMGIGVVEEEWSEEFLTVLNLFKYMTDKFYNIILKRLARGPKCQEF